MVSRRSATGGRLSILLARATLTFAVGFLLAAAAAFVASWMLAGLCGSMAVILALGRLARRSPQTQIALLATAATLSACLGIALLADVSPEWIEYRVRVGLVGPYYIGIWRADPRVGFAHVPSAIGQHRHPDFPGGRVTYTIDSDGWRKTPTPTQPVGEVWCLGCSYTFGHGVDDDQCYPARLARCWPRLKVRNMGVMAWESDQSLLVLEEQLRHRTPTLVLYGWLSHHIHRNGRRQSWLDHLKRFESLNGGKWRKPYFEVDSGRPVLRGLIGPESGLPDSEELLPDECRVSAALVLQMHQLCQSKQVPFVVVVLPEPLPRVVDDRIVVQDWIAAGVPVLDASVLEVPFYPHDRHPTAQAHQRIASAVARSIPFGPAIQTASTTPVTHR